MVPAAEKLVRLARAVVPAQVSGVLCVLKADGEVWAMTDMVTRVAQRMSMKLYGGYPVDSNNSREVMAQWERTKELAREVIEAMREPTDAMAFAAQKFMEKEVGSSATLQACAYSAATDAALKENEEKA